MNAMIGVNNRVNASVNSERESRIRGLESAIRLLGKKPVVEIDFVDIPDKNNPQYLRRITVHRTSATFAGGKINTTEADLPTLEDLSDAEMAWMGVINIAPFGNRKFRNQHDFTASVEVIREVDGFLYLLRCGFREMQPLDPVLVSLKQPTRQFVSYRISTTHDLTVAQLEEHFADVKPIPQPLIDEIVAMGFTQDGNLFNWCEEGTDYKMRIRVDLYGKLITPM